MAPPVALITGASSGMGLALTQHLLTKSWSVVLLDLNPPPRSASLPADRTLFISTDVSSWDAQASAFESAFAWHKRLDFVALNAGIDDRDDIFASISSDSTSPPQKPNMLTFEVNLFAPYYGLKLAAHYMSLNSPALGGKVVITASAAGLYALGPIPQYTSTKHGLVGLTRALGPIAKKVAITINAICPAIVLTGLAPPGLMDAFTEKQITPMSTILRAFDELGEFDRLGEGGGKESEEWVASGHTGQIVEASLGNLYYRDEVEHADDSQKYMAEGAADAWAKAYTERNRNFAMRDRINGKA